MLVAICDDDPRAMSRYSSEVVRICRENDILLQLATFESGTRFLSEVRTWADLPDIVLLDIGMPGVDGLQAAQALRDLEFTGAVVFITRQPDRMLDAFDVDAFNYVVKESPDEGERFARVFLQAVEAMRLKRRRYLVCKGASEHRNIPLDAIRYFSTNRHMCTAHYGRGATFDFVSTLGRLDNMLAASGFVRIQRSFTVNCAHVAGYSFRTCTLDDGTQLTVSRNRAAALREAMQAHAPEKPAGRKKK